MSLSLCLALEAGLLYPTNGSPLEMRLVNVAVPTLPSVPCDISPVPLDLLVVMCRTRYACPGMRSDERFALSLSSVWWQIRATPAVSAIINYKMFS